MKPTTPAQLPPAQREWYEERAALIEYGANITRAEAEKAAWGEVLRRIQESNQGG